MDPAAAAAAAAALAAGPAAPSPPRGRPHPGDAPVEPRRAAQAAQAATSAASAPFSSPPPGGCGGADPTPIPASTFGSGVTREPLQPRPPSATAARPAPPASPAPQLAAAPKEALAAPGADWTAFLPAGHPRHTAAPEATVVVPSEYAHLKGPGASYNKAVAGAAQLEREIAGLRAQLQRASEELHDKEGLAHALASKLEGARSALASQNVAAALAALGLDPALASRLARRPSVAPPASARAPPASTRPCRPAPPAAPAPFSPSHGDPDGGGGGLRGALGRALPAALQSLIRINNELAAEGDQVKWRMMYSSMKAAEARELYARNADLMRSSGAAAAGAPSPAERDAIARLDVFKRLEARSLVMYEKMRQRLEGIEGQRRRTLERVLEATQLLFVAPTSSSPRGPRRTRARRRRRRRRRRLGRAGGKPGGSPRRGGSGAGVAVVDLLRTPPQFATRSAHPMKAVGEPPAPRAGGALRADSQVATSAARAAARSQGANYLFHLPLGPGSTGAGTGTAGRAPRRSTRRRSSPASPRTRRPARARPAAAQRPATSPAAPGSLRGSVPALPVAGLTSAGAAGAGAALTDRTHVRVVSALSAARPAAGAQTARATARRPAGSPLASPGVRKSRAASVGSVDSEAVEAWGAPPGSPGPRPRGRRCPPQPGAPPRPPPSPAAGQGRAVGRGGRPASGAGGGNQFFLSSREEREMRDAMRRAVANVPPGPAYT
eukprot:tig00000093_g3660.t1